MTTLIHRPEYAAYDFGPEHPFTPSRLAMLLDLLRCLGHPATAVAAPAATREDILSVHDEAFVAMVEALDRGETRPEAERFGLGTADNPIFPGMDLAGRWLAGGALHGARLIMAGTERRVLQLGGGLHHAQKDRAAGFCLYNDLAVAIQAFVDRGWRVAYLDIDLHHGDGKGEGTGAGDDQDGRRDQERAIPGQPTQQGRAEREQPQNAGNHSRSLT